MADTTFVFAVLFSLAVDSLSYTLPAIPTERNFDSLFEEFTKFPFSLGSIDVLRVSPGYQVGLS